MPPNPLLCVLPHRAKGGNLWSECKLLPTHTFHLAYEKGGEEASWPPSFTLFWFSVITELEPWPQRKGNVVTFLFPTSYQFRRLGTISDYSNMNLVWAGKTTEVMEEHRLPYFSYCQYRTGKNQNDSSPCLTDSLHYMLY